MAIATTQLCSRQTALLASALPKSIDSVQVTSAGAAVAYTIPVNTGIVFLSTDNMCLFRHGGVAATIPSGQTDGEEAAWLHPGQDRGFRVASGDTISFKGDGVNDALVTIERYVGTNASLPPD